MEAETQEQPPGWKKLSLRILKYFGYVLLFVMAMQIGQLWLQRDVVVGKAPPISALDVDGRPATLAQYQGKPVLLYFWATWCPICKFEHGMMTSLAEDYQVLAVAIQSGSKEEVKMAMKVEEAEYRTINDPEGAIASQYGIRGVPTSFIIDGNGDIRAAVSGLTTGWSLRFRLWRLLEE